MSVEERLAGLVADNSDGVLATYELDGSQRSKSYGELWQRSARIAAGLQCLGVQADRPVVLLTQDILDFVPAFWACLRGGFIAVPLCSAAMDALHEQGGAMVRGALALLHRPILLADHHFLPLAERLGQDDGRTVIALAETEMQTGSLRPAQSAEPLCLIATSGSTGRLKLAALGRSAIFFRFLSAERRPQRVSSQSQLSTFPFDGISGLRGAFLWSRMWLQMPAHVLMGRPLSVLAAIEGLRVSKVAMSNSQAALILAAQEKSGTRWDLASLRMVGFGGEAVVPAVMRRFGQLLTDSGAPPGILLAGYGTTETGLLAVGQDPLAISPCDDEGATVPLGGCPAGVDRRIVDGNDQVLPDGAIGEVQVFCPQSIFSGYWSDPEASRNCLTIDGWWRTGDLGRLNGGQLTLHGRSKEVLIVRGKKYSLADIDAQLQGSLGLGIRTFSCAVLWPAEATERLAVVFVPSKSISSHPDAAAEIRRIVAFRVGLRPDPVIATTIDQIPLTAAGKLRRQELGERLMKGRFGSIVPVAKPAPASTATPRTRLDRLWREVLGSEGPLADEANFFDLGGDSHRSAQLFFRFEEEFGCHIAVDKFFATPTFATMLRSVEGDAVSNNLAVQSGAADSPWPLPDELRYRILSYFEAWDGDRPTRDRLVAGLNTNGTKPPIFWIFQDGQEFSALARHLGPDQPLYALRSGHLIIKYTEDEIQTLALRYVHEITQVCPQGTLFLGGNCQGGIIALAIAQHLLRRKRHVPLLILMEWGFPPQPYAGPVLLVYGQDSTVGNPHKRYLHPHLAWRRIFADYNEAEIPGAHGTFFDEPNISALAQTLARHLDGAASASLQVLPHLAYKARLEAKALPSRMAPGERRLIEVEVENASPVAWNGWERSGLMLGNYWVDETGAVIAWLDGRLPLPALVPGATLRLTLAITAPLMVGTARLIIDLVEEGGTWFEPSRNGVLQSNVALAPTPIEAGDSDVDHFVGRYVSKADGDPQGTPNLGDSLRVFAALPDLTQVTVRLGPACRCLIQGYTAPGNADSLVHFLQDLGVHHVDVMAVDLLDLPAIYERFALKMPQMGFIQADAGDLRAVFPDHQFDVVVQDFLLNCAPPQQAERLLGEAMRVLKPDGLAFLSFTDSSCLAERPSLSPREFEMRWGVSWNPACRGLSDLVPDERRRQDLLRLLAGSVIADPATGQHVLITPPYGRFEFFTPLEQTLRQLSTAGFDAQLIHRQTGRDDNGLDCARYRCLARPGKTGGE
jgi:acyl-CoA synthetase (AMP-forming)/AMP-acid ligase II/thioesterase domain-containing protein/SAM-dependent methyltransferase/acyl carrier protein